jgi:hypothetical protein
LAGAARPPRSPPRQIPNVEGDAPLFDPNGDILFRARERDYGFGTVSTQTAPA